MAYTIDWFIDKAVILESIIDTVTLDEVREQAEILDRMIDETDRSLVHIIIDISQITTIPTSVREVASGSGKILKNPRLGWTILYGNDSKMLKFAAGMVTQIFKVRSRLFATEAEALAFLAEHDEELRPQLSEHLPN